MREEENFAQTKSIFPPKPPCTVYALSGPTQVAPRPVPNGTIRAFGALNVNVNPSRPTPNRFPENVDDDDLMDRERRTARARDADSSESDNDAMGSDVFSNRGDNDDVSLHEEPTSVGTDNGFEARRMGMWLGFRDRPSPSLGRGNAMDSEVGDDSCSGSSVTNKFITYRTCPRRLPGPSPNVDRANGKCPIPTVSNPTVAPPLNVVPFPLPLHSVPRPSVRPFWAGPTPASPFRPYCRVSGLPSPPSYLSPSPPPARPVHSSLFGNGRRSRAASPAPRQGTATAALGLIMNQSTRDAREDEDKAELLSNMSLS